MSKEKAKRNQPCSCGSELKYKRCCLLKSKQAVAEDLLRKRQLSAAVNSSPETRQVTAVAMANAGIPGDVVFAYLETGIYIRDPSTSAHSPAKLAEWQRSIDRYNRIHKESNSVPHTREVVNSGGNPAEEADCRITRV